MGSKAFWDPWDQGAPACPGGALALLSSRQLGAAFKVTLSWSSESSREASQTLDLGVLVSGKCAHFPLDTVSGDSSGGWGSWTPSWGGTAKLKAGSRGCCLSFWCWISGGRRGVLVPVQVCLDFTSLIFERALNTLAFKVIYTWQNVAFSLEGKKGIKGILDTK